MQSRWHLFCLKSTRSVREVIWMQFTMVCNIFWNRISFFIFKKFRQISWILSTAAGRRVTKICRTTEISWFSSKTIHESQPYHFFRTADHFPWRWVDFRTPCGIRLPAAEILAKLLSAMIFRSLNADLRIGLWNACPSQHKRPSS